jgi:hypothetical protein
MNEILQRLTSKDAAELGEIKGLFDVVESRSMHDLSELTKDVLSLQPAFPSIYTLFATKCDYTKEQLNIILRYLMVIWLFYRERMPHKRKIDDPLYTKMKEEQAAWNKRLEMKNKEARAVMFTRWIEEYPSKGMLLTLHVHCMSDPQGAFSSMSKKDRYFVFHAFKALMDCCEWLIKAS